MFVKVNIECSTISYLLYITEFFLTERNDIKYFELESEKKGTAFQVSLFTVMSEILV